jgi:hypothetical protein
VPVAEASRPTIAQAIRQICPICVVPDGTQVMAAYDARATPKALFC